MFDASILTGPIANYPVADSFNRALERDRSTGDIPNVFVSSVVWDVPLGQGRSPQLRGVAGAIPSGWTVAGLVTLQSGVPIAATQATNFNLLNTPPLGAPDGTLGAASFGTITTAGDPRVVQLAFKLLF